MRFWKFPLVFVAFAMVGSAHAICLSPFGCEPATLDACNSEAAKMPTERGVTVAVNVCMEKFVYRPENVQRVREEKLRSTAWEKVISSPPGLTFSQVHKLLGDPLESGDVQACVDEKGEPTAVPCRWHEWDAKSEPEQCKVFLLTDPKSKPFVYRAEFVDDTKILNRWYPPKISTCEYPISSQTNYKRSLSSRKPTK